MSAVASGFFVTGGTLRHDAPSYVERRADHDLLDSLLRGQFCYVLTSRQMGKSSLMVRTASRLREQGVQVVALDLTAVGQNVTPEQWYDGMLLRMAGQLGLEDELEDFWAANRRLSPVQRFFQAIQSVVLARQGGALVVFVDEIDVVRSLSFKTDEFFAAIREIYNRRTEHEPMRRVSFCLLGVAAPSDLIADTRMTPFNVGRRIELNDFTPDEAAPLARGLGNAERGTRAAEVLLRRVLHWTNGHPYLTQRLCQALANRPNVRDAAGVDALCDELFLSRRARDQDDNLLFVRDRILRSEEDRATLLYFYESILKGRNVADDGTDPLVGVLRLAGVVRSEDGRLVPRNRIYERVFDRQWITQNMPDADLRRQRAAFYRGVARTTAIAAVVVAALAVMVIIAVNRARRERQALAQSYFSQAQATRRSGLAGQRLDSLAALKAARSSFTNEAMLRNEAIACLALMDLRDTPAGELPNGGVSTVSRDTTLRATGERDGSVTIRRIEGGEILKTLPRRASPVTRLRFAPEDHLLLAAYPGGERPEIVVWDWRAGNALVSLAQEIHGQAIDFSADGQKLALGDSTGRVRIHSLPTGAVLSEFDLKLKTGRPRVPQVLRFSPSGEFLAEASRDEQTVQVWSWKEPPGPGTAPPALYHTAEVNDLAWHPRGELLATACADSVIHLWSTNRWERAKKWIGHEGAVTAVVFNHRGTLMASLGQDETIRLWMPATDRQMVARLNSEGYDHLAFSASDHRLMATGPRPTAPRLWEVVGGEYLALHMQRGPPEPWRNIDFSPDSSRLAATSSQRAMIWETDTGREAGALNFLNAHAAWFSADSEHLLATTYDGLFRGSVREPDLGSRDGGIRKLRLAGDETGAISFTPDRTMAAIIHRDEVLAVKISSEGVTSRRNIALGTHHHRVALDSTGRWMATMVGGSNTVHLWDLSAPESRPPAAVVPGTEYFAFSPDGRWLATCWAGRFGIYRVPDWSKPAFEIARKPASDRHAPAAFTPDGSVIALASSRYTIQLLRLAAGAQPAEMATLEAPDRSPLEMLAFSPDGRFLAAATQDQMIELWNVSLLRSRLAELNLHQDWLEFPSATNSRNPADNPLKPAIHDTEN